MQREVVTAVVALVCACFFSTFCHNESFEHFCAPAQASVLWALHQQATDDDGGDQLCGAGEEGLAEGWEVLEGRGGYGGGFWSLFILLTSG